MNVEIAAALTMIFLWLIVGAILYWIMWVVFSTFISLVVRMIRSYE